MVSSLQDYLSRLVEQPEPAIKGNWYPVVRDALPFGYVEFHFDDAGKLTTVRLSNAQGEVLVSSEVEGEQ